MNKIEKTETLKQILSDSRFTVDSYQREYRWGRKQIEQMIEDLVDTFRQFYDPEKHDDVGEVKKYGYYFMGSIICTGIPDRNIIDGQQRLTSLTLLLIYLNNLQRTLPDIEGLPVGFDNMIYSIDFGKQCYNLDVKERAACMEALICSDTNYLPEGESNKNMLERYGDIEELFPEDLKGEALPYFIYWVIEKVLLLQVNTPSEDEAHTIFLTMNDRGLSLNSAEMMKAYLIQQTDEGDRRAVNEAWKRNITKIKSAEETEGNSPSKAEDVEFISTWLRARYASSLRDGKKGSVDRDFELLGDKFHSWVRANAKSTMGLSKPTQYRSFVVWEMTKVTDLYLRLKRYSETLTDGFEAVFYNANRDLNYQIMLIISAVSNEDGPKEIDQKIMMISEFVDYFATVRIFNYKKVNWNTNKAYLFRLMTSIREKDVKTVGITLTRAMQRMNERLEGIYHFELNQFTGRYMLHILARLTAFVNESMAYPSGFKEYIDRKSKVTYDIEHVLPDDYETYKNLFNDEEDFQNNRRKFGNLLILTEDRNRSYQAMLYEEKVERYMGDNILAKSLHPLAYKNNPRFMKLKNTYGFKPYSHFDKSAIQQRTALYYELARKIWDPNRIREIAGGWTLDDEAIVEVETVGKNYTVEYANRSWPDAVKYGFLSANQSNSGKTIGNISVGDMVFCHITGKGFVGVGTCCKSAVPMKHFTIMMENKNTPITEVEWIHDDMKKECDPEEEWFIGVDWLRTVELEDGYWEKGLTTVPLVAYVVNNDTHDKVLKHFRIVERV